MSQHKKTTTALIRLQLPIVSGSITFDCFAPALLVHISNIVALIDILVINALTLSRERKIEEEIKRI